MANRRHTARSKDNRECPEKYGATSQTCPAHPDKVRYPTRAAAKIASSSLRKRGNHLRPYKCDRCGAFHVGHVPQAAMLGERPAHECYRPTR